MVQCRAACRAVDLARNRRDRSEDVESQVETEAELDRYRRTCLIAEDVERREKTEELRRGAGSEEVFPSGIPFARHTHQVGSRSREPGDIDSLVALVIKRFARGDQRRAGAVIELDMRIERVDKFARPVRRRAGFELQPAVDDRDAVPIINRRLTDQRALAGADEGIRPIVESQQQRGRALACQLP